MKLHSLAGGLAALLLVGAAHATAAAPSSDIAAAVADPTRPDADKALDSERKPAEILSFIRLKPGQTIVDVFPGDYWDRLFADVVGPRGHVVAFYPAEIAKFKKGGLPLTGSHPFPDHPNIEAVTAPIDAFAVPKRADVIWIRQNYHDLYDHFMGPADVPGFDKAVFKALRPGGYFVVIDHVAPAGSDLASTNTTHRIDPERVKRDMAAAGFKFVASSAALKNPEDDHTKAVFDKSLRGHTDQFVFLFQKPYPMPLD
ncbi:MAG: class I SAM-dependent methyltransferase [Alphaproteobacteria bacterium]|nr:class I SAM-dependent methyltransferase [Alphaproteobacteria bacterium]